MLKYKDHSKAFDILRFFGGYSYTRNQKWALTAVFIVQLRLNRNNTNVDVYFGAVPVHSPRPQNAPVSAENRLTGWLSALYGGGKARTRHSRARSGGRLE